MSDFLTPKEALDRLAKGNQCYLTARRNPADISREVRWKTAHHGQRPFATVLTCSDSRVPPEHIFSAGIGEIFVVRTAGNVVGAFELGSIEYATEHLHTPAVLVMGHSHCGAVAAALDGHADGYIEDIVREIQRGLQGATDEDTAIYNNILHSKRQMMKSEIVQHLVRAGRLVIACAKYEIATGKVNFLKY